MSGSRRLLALAAVVGVVGAAALAVAATTVAALPASQLISATVLGAAVVASGFWSVKIPGRLAHISVSEVFVFVAMLLVGWEAAAMMVALDGALVSMRHRRRRWDRAIFNVTEPVTSVFVAGLAFTAVRAQVLLWAPDWVSGAATAGAFAMAAVFFASNSVLTALAIASDSRTSAVNVWKGHASHLALNYYAAAAIAILVVPGDDGIELRAVGIIAPLLFLSFVAYREAAQRTIDAEQHAADVEALYAEARQRHEALSQAQKLEALGRLAGGLSHDFNNMMTAIRGYAEMTRDVLPAGSEVHHDVGEIIAAADRAAGLARQLLAFSRRHVTEPKVVWPDRVIASMNGMLLRRVGEDITIVSSAVTKVAKVRIDPVQLEQVVMNLVVNAKDAMPAGGRITIALAEATLSATRGEGTALPPGTYVRLSVTDTGCGMSEDVKTKVFEPFFTTKADGRGTGLGLATVFGIIDQNGGAIVIDSAVDAGTTFRIYLPTTTEAETVAQDVQPDASGPCPGTVLVVEDDAAVATLVTRGLRNAGFDVLRAVDAHQALELARCHIGPIDLLLTDVVMPGMNGRELSDRIVQVRSEVRLLFMSGYSDDAILQRGVEASAVAFIQKPFTMPGLVARVQSLLVASPAA